MSSPVADKDERIRLLNTVPFCKSLGQGLAPLCVAPPHSAVIKLERAWQCCNDGNVESAVANLKSAISEGLNSESAIISLALLFYEMGAYDEVRFTVEDVLLKNPTSGSALCIRLLASVALGLWPDVYIDIQRLHFGRDLDVDLLYQLGISLVKMERDAEAIVIFDIAASASPLSSKVLAARGECYARAHNFSSAESDFRQAIAIDCENAAIINDLAVLLHTFDNSAEALSLLEKAITLTTESPHVWFNHGNVLRSLGRRENALQSYGRAIALMSDFVDAIYNKGLTHYEQLELESALECYNRVLTIDPAHSNARWNKAICTLLKGDWKTGWALYEARWEVEIGGWPSISIPGVSRWTGSEPLAGKSVLVIAEQGFGDAIQFSRYLESLKERGATVTVYARVQLEKLFRGVKGVSGFVRSGSVPPLTDYFVPMMSLPAALGMYSPGASPATNYLRADPMRMERVLRKLVKTQKPKLGVAWRGSPTNASDHQRSITLSIFACCFIDDFEIFCLQKDLVEDEKKQLQRNGVHLVGNCDFADAAALISSMDLVITVDTSFAHLAGALNVPVWILLPYVPDWRWGLIRRDSPWYPTATLYRQQADRCWQRVLEEVRIDLSSQIIARPSTKTQPMSEMVQG